MRFQIFLAFVMLTTSMTWAWTESETNAVGHALAELVAISSGTDDMPLPPDDPAANEPIDEPYPTFESLFAGDLPIAVGWSAPEKRTAFFHYLGTITNMVTDGIFTGNVWHAASALSFCRLKGDPAVLPYALGILAATNMPASLEQESSVILWRFAAPSMEMNVLIEGIVSNPGCLKGAHTRANVYADYCDKLSHVYDAGQTNVARNGAAVLYRNLLDHNGAKALDLLLQKTFAGYSTSSNRMFVAQRALLTDPSEEWTHGYFANITNQLIGIGAPLPVVDGL